jgi:hypothetical protein
MGKPVAILFAVAALAIIGASFTAPTATASKSECAPAYGVDPCAVEKASAN